MGNRNKKLAPKTPAPPPERREKPEVPRREPYWPGAQTFLFAATLFLSAALLFSVQPMFAKMVLPRFGGAPAVWNTCLVFYQAVLLAGYLYAHLSVKWLGPRKQAALHLAVLLAPWIVLPIRIAENWSPPADAFPVPWVWLLLSLSVGLPFFVVSASAPVLQAWFAETGNRSARDPYFLYSASNLGSLLALLSYPLAIEAYLSLGAQAWTWTAGYGLLIALLCACATRMWLSPKALFAEAEPRVAGPSEEDSSPLGFARRLRWVLLAAIPSSLLLGVTAHVTVDIVSMPLLWVIPLALYLLTFVIVFARRPILAHRWMVRMQPLVLVAAVGSLIWKATEPTSVLLVGSLHLLAFFLTAMVCHGELAADRPAAGRLTEFYLWMSVGGVLGGLFNALAAPLLFATVLEYPLALAAACMVRPRIAAMRKGPPYREWIVPGMALVIAAMIWGIGEIFAISGRRYYGMAVVNLSLAVLAACAAFSLRRRPLPFGLAVAALAALSLKCAESASQTLHVERSFFGILQIKRDPAANTNFLIHGLTNHGQQCRDDDRRREPLSYYHKQGPLGGVFRALQKRRPLKEIGALGLGAGTIAAYGLPGERITFYEIDPAVERIARRPEYFTYLADCRANVEVVLGDARLSLARGPARQFDLLILDAFNSDAVPLHLLTREAFAVYLKRLAERGVLAAHVSSRYLNLEPALGRVAEDAGLTALICRDEEVEEIGKFATDWVVMARRAADLGPLADDPRWEPLPTIAGRIWTDDFSNIVDAIELENSWDWLVPSSRQRNAEAREHAAKGTKLARQGRMEEAIAEFEKALEIDPQYAEAHGNLGAALASLDRLDEAIDHYRQALELRPEGAKTHNNLALALARRGKIDAAIPHWQCAVELNPTLAEAHQNLGMMPYMRGQTAMALARWRQGLRDCPDDVMLLCLIARTLATHEDSALRHGSEAVELAGRATRISGGRDAAVLDVLAAAYAEAGRFPEAVESAEKALALAGNNAALKTALEEKLKLYRAGAAFREPHPSPPPKLRAP
ncbi:MAG: fused MFS/spermidine synthase [Pirellulales bacterium]|nr:fused MFS/spermidine synthase [Pirellulales bacterium]